MKINSTNINFGKNLIGTCKVKDIYDKKMHPAVIYEYNPCDTQDIIEVKTSPYTSSIHDSFYKASLIGGYSKFYVIQDDLNNEIISSSEITNHTGSSSLGSYLEIDNIQGNQTYVDSLRPMIGHIANMAYESNSDNIVAFEDGMSSKDFINFNFDEKEDGVWTMSKDKFSDSIEKAGKINSIDYNA